MADPRFSAASEAEIARMHDIIARAISSDGLTHSGLRRAARDVYEHMNDAAQPPAAASDDRKTITVPPGYEDVRDADGRATGEVRKIPTDAQAVGMREALEAVQSEIVLTGHLAEIVDAALAAQPPAAPVETKRKTFTIPPGHEAVRDSEGRATGEVVRAPAAPVETDPLYDSRNPNHGRTGGLRDAAPEQCSAGSESLKLAEKLAAMPLDMSHHTWPTVVPIRLTETDRELIVSVLRAHGRRTNVPQRALYPAADCQCDPPGGAKCARCYAESKHCIHGVSLTTPCATCENDYGNERACTVTHPHGATPDQQSVKVPELLARAQQYLDFNAAESGADGLIAELIEALRQLTPSALDASTLAQRLPE